MKQSGRKRWKFFRLPFSRKGKRGTNKNGKKYSDHAFEATVVKIQARFRGRQERKKFDAYLAKLIEDLVALKEKRNLPPQPPSHQNEESKQAVDNNIKNNDNDDEESIIEEEIIVVIDDDDDYSDDASDDGREETVLEIVTITTGSSHEEKPAAPAPPKPKPLSPFELYNQQRKDQAENPPPRKPVKPWKRPAPPAASTQTGSSTPSWVKQPTSTSAKASTSASSSASKRAPVASANTASAASAPAAPTTPGWKKPASTTRAAASTRWKKPVAQSSNLSSAPPPTSSSSTTPKHHHKSAVVHRYIEVANQNNTRRSSRLADIEADRARGRWTARTGANQEGKNVQKSTPTEEAAVKIQALVRMFLARRRVSLLVSSIFDDLVPKPAAKELLTSTAPQLPSPLPPSSLPPPPKRPHKSALVNRYIEAANQKTKRRSTMLADVEADRARGRWTAAAVINELDKEPQEEEPHIPDVTRKKPSTGFAGAVRENRERIEEKTSDEEAAVKLQALVRSFLARRQVSRLVSSIFDDLMPESANKKAPAPTQKVGPKPKKGKDANKAASFPKTFPTKAQVTEVDDGDNNYEGYDDSKALPLWWMEQVPHFLQDKRDLEDELRQGNAKKIAVEYRKPHVHKDIERKKTDENNKNKNIIKDKDKDKKENKPPASSGSIKGQKKEPSFRDILTSLSGDGDGSYYVVFEDRETDTEDDNDKLTVGESSSTQKTVPKTTGSNNNESNNRKKSKKGPFKRKLLSFFKKFRRVPSNKTDTSEDRNPVSDGSSQSPEFLVDRVPSPDLEIVVKQ